VTAPDTRSGQRLRALSDVSSERTLESLGLSVGAVAFILTALIALPVFGYQDAPIAGPGSTGSYAALASAVAAILAFLAGRYVLRDRSGRGARIVVLDVIDVAFLALAHGIIGLLSWTLIVDLVDQAFQDAMVFAFPVLVLTGAAAALTAYVAFYSATHMDLQLLAIVLAVFMVEGILASMLTASDPHWWKDNLSALGMTDDLSALAFNLTLIVAGILVTTLARFSTRGIPVPYPRALVNVRTCLVVVGVFLGLVGVFPVDQFFALHTGVASGMAVAYGILVIRLPKWIPGMPRLFFWLGWLFIAIVVVLAVLFAVGYYTLTAVELVAGILIFSWIILFIRNAAALELDAHGSDRAAAPSPV
jgi:hypothetical membrane protein